MTGGFRTFFCFRFFVSLPFATDFLHLL